jgi:hypothetical protein
MTNRLLRIAIAVLAGVLVVPMAMQAREHEHGRGRHRVENHYRYSRRDHDRGWVYGGVRFYGRGDDDDAYEGGYYGYGPVYYGPPARYYGREGWRGCDLPPGLAKKYGCAPYYDRRYYRPYYRPDGTAIWVRIGIGR